MITLKTLAQATEQEVFDQACEHLIRQGKKSERVNSEGKCFMYRDDSGAKCAAGCFIADDEYKINFEGKSWFGLTADESSTKAHLEMIVRLQRIHDRYDVHEWHNELKDMANEHGLQIPEILK